MIALLTQAAWGAGTFGKVVQIGGQSADLALDQTRGVMYVADFSGNRIDVMSLASNTVQTSINVAANPASISLSPDGHWLIVAHFGNNASPASPTNVVTLIDLTNHNAKQTFNLAYPPLGAAFGADGTALIVTTQQYLNFDPSTGAITLVDTIADVAAKTLPVPAGTPPSEITRASVAASADGRIIFGMGNATGAFTFTYDALAHAVLPGGVVLASGTLEPRVVSVNSKGTDSFAGWVMIDSNSVFINNLASGNVPGVGTTVFDDKHGLIYSQMPIVAGEAPTLQILANDNLTLIDRLNLPENTTGRAVMSADGNTMYAVSASGILVLPVGSLSSASRLAVSTPDLVFRGNFCNRSLASQTLSITDPGGNHTPFSIAPSGAGVTVSPATGVTPATVTVTVDPNAFAAATGTSAVTLTVSSSTAVNTSRTVRVLVNQAAPDQRGSFLDIPGTLVDVLADPIRARYYVLRGDNNSVLVFNSSNNTQIATLRTYNAPTSMAISLDGEYLYIGHSLSQALAVYDLNTFTQQPYIGTEAGNGDTVRSIAVSTNAILATAVDYTGKGHVIFVDPLTRTSSQPASLGNFENNINPDSVAAASSNASNVIIATSDGFTFLYDANVGSFTVSRNDFTALSGAYAASPFDQYVVGNNLLNASLVPIGTLESASGSPSGFAFVDLGAVRTTAPNSSSAGVVERVDLTSGAAITPTRMVEAPLLNTTLVSLSATGTTAPSVFTRTLAPLADRTAIIALTTSGVTILPWNYDASVAPPVISAVVSAADGRSAPAPGGLISIYGSLLSPTNQATTQIPVPTALGNSCVTVNGQPMPLIFVSSSQINAQMPFQALGNVTVVLHTPGGVSDNFNLTVLPNSPAVFLSGVAGPQTNIPTVVRAINGLLVTDSDPVHIGDALTIYTTGLGLTTPQVSNGQPAPSSPLAFALTQPTVTLGNASVFVTYAGLAPGEVGVYQINVVIPGGVPLGFGVPLTISQGGVSFTTNVRVID